MDLKFVWEDESWGYHRCTLYENDEKIDDMSFEDYTTEFHQKSDKENGFERPYSFVARWCHGWSMEHGFDEDENCYHHFDENGHVIGGYQGTCTHTVDDIKNWCEEWLAQGYIQSYENMLARLESSKNRAKWFKANGYGNRNLKED